jgi:hypothetical protein
VLKNAGVLAPAFFFMDGFSFSLCCEDSKFMIMKAFRINCLIVFFLAVHALYGADYDVSLYMEAPPVRYGRSLENRFIIQPGITFYPQKGLWYVSSTAGAGAGWTELLFSGGMYYYSGKNRFHPEFAMGWTGQPDSITASVKVTMNRTEKIPWSISVDGDLFSGRLYARSEIRKYADWKMPWIFTGYTAVNLTDYYMGKVSRSAGLSDVGLGITTWAEIGPYYAELSLVGGPTFNQFNYDTIILTLRLLLIWNRGG